MSNRLYGKKLMMEQRAREKHDFVRATPRHRPEDEDEEGNPTRVISDDDIDVSFFLCPSVEDQLNRPGSSLNGISIMHEITTSPYRAFVEGEPIGAYVKRKPWRAPKDVRPIGHYRQEAMLHLRHKNDLAMALILRKEL